MKLRIFSAFAAVAVFLLVSCSNSSSPSGDATVKIVSSIANPVVNIAKVKGSSNEILSNEVDSIKVKTVRVLMLGMKLYGDKEDTASAGKVLKTDHYVYDADVAAGNLIQIASGSVPAGIYDKIKFEFHRFSTSEATQNENDETFKDFATSDRYSMIITGTVYKDNVPTDFTFNSQATANLLLKFDPSLNLTSGSTTTLAIQVDPNLFFKKGSSILDPRIAANQNDIENAIKSTIKAVKK